MEPVVLQLTLGLPDGVGKGQHLLPLGGVCVRSCAMAKVTSIEDHFHAIETAVAALESGELPLEEALTRYEAGLKSVRAAKTLLDRYAARLSELRAEDDQPPAERG